MARAKEHLPPAERDALDALIYDRDWRKGDLAAALLDAGVEGVTEHVVAWHRYQHCATCHGEDE